MKDSNIYIYIIVMRYNNKGDKFFLKKKKIQELLW